MQRLQYTILEDVALVSRSTTVTTIHPGVAGYQAAWGDLRGGGVGQMDGNATRKGLLIFPPMVSSPDLPAGDFQVSVTELTAFRAGANAMPATLPATSGYTYAAELAVAGHEEAHVNWNVPVSFYVDNFLSFPNDGPVPLGVYNPDTSRWEPMASGRIITISGIDGTGKATLQAPVGVTLPDGERVALADAYRAEVCGGAPSCTAPAAVPKSLWRMPLPHFSEVDANWGIGLPAGAKGAANGASARPDVNTCKTQSKGSIIECQNSVLGEELPIAGTPYSLTYWSSRAEASNTTVEFPITEGTVPNPAPIRIEADVEVAGRRERIVRTAPFSPNQTLTWTWDRQDAFGHHVEGAVRAKATIRYVFQGLVGTTINFAEYPSTTNIGGNRQNRELWIERSDALSLGSRSTKHLGLGGWQLSAHGLYDPASLSFHTGSGRTVVTEGSIARVVGGASSGPASPGGTLANGSRMAGPRAVAVTPSGKLYWSDYNYGVRSLAADGTIEDISGVGTCYAPNPTWPAGAGDVIAASDVCAPLASSMVAATDGTVYVADASLNRIVAFKGGTGTLIAGRKDGAPGYFVDGAVASGSALTNVTGLTIDPEGNLLFAVKAAASGSFWIVKLEANGTLRRVAGDPAGAVCSTTNDDAAVANVCFPDVADLDVDALGNVYVSSLVSANSGSRIRIIRPDGRVTRVVGSSAGGTTDRGGRLGTETRLNSPRTLRYVGGTLYFTDWIDRQIRSLRPDGKVSEVLGIFNGDVTPAESGTVTHPLRTQMGQSEWFAVGPSKDFYVPLTFGANSIGRVADPITRSVVDGDVVHELDTEGRHASTRSRLRGTLLRSFGYESNKTLAYVTDAVGNTTTFSGSGSSRTITAPNGMQTVLTFDPNGYLAKVTSPDASERHVVMNAKGLLVELGSNGDADPAKAHHFSYDGEGRLVTDLSPDAQSQPQRLSATKDFPKRVVTHTTAEGRAKIYEVDRNPAAVVGQLAPFEKLVNTVVTGAAGSSLTTLVSSIEKYPNKRTGVASDGSTYVIDFTSDPKYGSSGQYGSKKVFETYPGGGAANRTETATHARTIAPDDSEQVDVATVNGLAWETRFTRATSTITTKSPLLRTTKTWLDATIDRAVKMQVGPGASDPVTPDPVLLHPVEYTYEPGPGPQQGKIATVSVGGRTVTYTYDAGGHVSSVTAPDSKVTTFDFRDAMGRVTQMTLPGGRVVTRAYDVHGNVTSVVPPINGSLAPASHEMTYSPSGNLLASYLAPEVGGAPRATSYTYDRDELLKELISPVGSLKKTVSRDAAGRIVATNETNDGANRTRTFTYGTTGQLTQQVATEVAAATTSATQAFGYLGSRHTTDTQTVAPGGSARTLTRDHDSFLRLSTMSLQGVGASLTYGYDSDGLVNDIGGLVATRGTTVGLVKQLERAGKEKETLTYDAYGAPLTMLASYNGVSKGGLTLTFDPASGRIVTKAEAWTFAGLSSKTWTYTYDAAGRLFEASDGVTTKSYTYDDNGNRTGATVDAQDRVTSQTDDGVTTTYTYDTHGNVITRARGAVNQALTWDSQGSLLTVTDGTTVKYVVDAQGRRVGRRVGANLDREWFYDGQLRIVGEVVYVSGTPTRFRLYGYLPERHLPVTMTETVGATTKTYRIYGDHLGSLRAVVESSSGNVVQVMQHGPWGEVDVDTVTGPFVRVPFGFAGGNYDEITGLVRFGAREYDARTGRWLSKDEARFGGGWNFYEYAGGDPVRFMDVDGHMRLPSTPSGLPPEWVKDDTHKYPHGTRYRHPNGDTLDWHPARPGAGGHAEKDHWHPNRKGKTGRKGKPKEEPYYPGEEIPDPEPVCEDPGMSGEPVDANPEEEPCADLYEAHVPYWIFLFGGPALRTCAGVADFAEMAAEAGELEEAMGY